jgi:hypothetical protein
MNENISSTIGKNIRNHVRFDDNIIIIEYDAKKRICRKHNTMNKLLKFIMSFIKNSKFFILCYIKVQGL